ncbi:Zinc finger, CCHC-type superfamily [Sesbania bispinosa]|nr:Zinc finger, CCHC-type superfamily [Sesbania bispinosa]
MDKEVRSTVRYASTAREIWMELEESAFVLQKLKGLWDEIQSIAPWPKYTCGGWKCDVQKQLTHMRERDQLYDFLKGLDDVFGIMKTQTFSMKSMVSLGHAYHLVAEDEQQRIISAMHKPTTETVTFQTQNARYKEGAERRDARKEKPKCSHCQKIGHTEDKCYEIIGYPPKWKKSGQEKRDKAGPWNEKRNGLKAAQVATEGSPIPGLSKQ